MTDLHINALATEVCVNMGDHAESVTRAIAITPDMTVRELCEKYLMRESWVGFEEPAQVKPDDTGYLTIRLAAGAPGE